jgi:hypothetical protein
MVHSHTEKYHQHNTESRRLPTTKQNCGNLPSKFLEFSKYLLLAYSYERNEHQQVSARNEVVFPAKLPKDKWFGLYALL